MALQRKIGRRSHGHCEPGCRAPSLDLERIPPSFSSWKYLSSWEQKAADRVFTRAMLSSN
jgi:hypothetical protein